MSADVMQRWHAAIQDPCTDSFKAILAEEATFHSPVVHMPQNGREITCAYLAAAGTVLGNANFEYVREVVGERDAVLEFTAQLDGVDINGVDMLRWNSEGEIVEIKVMIRPLKAINHIHQLMGLQLEA